MDIHQLVKWGTYIRFDSSSRPVNQDMFEELQTQTKHATYDLEPVPHLRIGAELVKGVLGRLKRLPMTEAFGNNRLSVMEKMESVSPSITHEVGEAASAWRKADGKYLHYEEKDGDPLQRHAKLIKKREDPHPLTRHLDILLLQMDFEVVRLDGHRTSLFLPCHASFMLCIQMLGPIPLGAIDIALLCSLGPAA